ncbi:2'-5'-oligoadenylate synthase 1A-like [Asterias rubens]|uniref:2'-5'-oligoadenylate synthase 1A-like n=1 Tax=Asterias rubens TaxID=7604 RepID=UPI001455C69F|nr:2'-5'-oligoadenylate synthase 1A-like [Asterias rubens]
MFIHVLFFNFYRIVPVERKPSACGDGLDLEKEVREKPWCLSPDELENWYNDSSENMQHRTEQFATECSSLIESVRISICNSTRHMDTLDFTDRVVKGGSFGKETMVENLSDVDLVVFVNRPELQLITETENLEKYKSALPKIISHLKYNVSNEPTMQDGLRFTKHSVNFKLKARERLVEFNLLPTTEENVRHFRHKAGELQAFVGPRKISYYLNGQSLNIQCLILVYFFLANRNMFESMLDVGTDDVGRETREFYYASFVEHQVRFVKEQPSHVKELIRLVKYWASRFLPKYLQKSYPLELITIYRWEKAGKPGRRLNKARGLRSVLEVLTKLDRLRVYWNFMDGVDDNLNETIIKRLNMERPIILDPANPTNNVGDLYQKNDNKEVIKAAAEKTLQTDLLSDVSAW